MAKRRRYDEYMVLAPGEGVAGHATTYVVDRIVGTGAFAAVYFALDPAKPGRQVALKEFFAPRSPRDLPTLQALFDRERFVSMQASPHPLMPTFYEAFSLDGHFYIAQEFIQGSTLDEIIQRRHPLPREWVLKWAVSLCSALAFLHSRQIVHHDIKPANIRITPQGHLFLLDFGAAQYFGKGYEDEPLTAFYGTDGYLPPELEDNTHWVADVRTDIFALGCVLYEMIAGVPPDQKSINARSMYVTNTLIQQPNADLGLVKLINKALSYNTEYRYAGAIEFLSDMRQIALPVLLVDKKHLRWGEIPPNQLSKPQVVSLQNAGGSEMRGEIKPRASWITVSTTSFRGNNAHFSVSVDVNKIPERGQLVTGRLEVNTPDIRDDDGNLISTGDRWFIDCSVTVLPRRGYLVVPCMLAAGSGPIKLSARKGQPATATFDLRNSGETPIGYRIMADDSTSAITGQPLDITFSPDSGNLDPDEVKLITVRIGTKSIPSGSHQINVLVCPGIGKSFSVPLDLRVYSLIEYLKLNMGIGKA